jgi:diacylglycerol kinase (ATP)
LLPIAALLQVSPPERALLAATVLLVLLVELINSSVEAAIDRISLDYNELSGRAKDCGSAAVTVALIICVMTWCIIVGPPVMAWFHR